MPTILHWLRSLAGFQSLNRRSVVFLHHSYYHFFYLARALRKRGWDALTVSLEDPNGPNAAFFHGEDLNLYSPNDQLSLAKLRSFFTQAKRRFHLLHFAGDGCMSFFPANFMLDDPPDIVEWRSLGKRVAHTVSGCNSGTAQSSVARWSSLMGSVNVCEKCIWQSRPDVCHDEKNLAWGQKLAKYCDLTFSETIPALDYMQSSSKVIREPVTTALDPVVWNPRLDIPPEHRIERKGGELLVYHAFGNYNARSNEGHNIKGTPAVKAAIDRLQAEGFPVRLIFVTGMKNLDVRYVQAQVDVIIDQLNYGRYGATAREGMMLGKPVICYINPHELRREDELQCLKDVPLVSASESNVYDVLKDLLLNPGKRRSIGMASRAYAMKWHSADACAERYERIYDGLMLRNSHASEVRSSA
jgi:hypothetical protein